MDHVEPRPFKRFPGGFTVIFSSPKKKSLTITIIVLFFDKKLCLKMCYSENLLIYITITVILRSGSPARYAAIKMAIKWDDMGWYGMLPTSAISETVLSAMVKLAVWSCCQSDLSVFTTAILTIFDPYPDSLSQCLVCFQIFELVCQDIVFVGSFWVIQISRYHNTLKKESPSFIFI